MVNKKNKLYGIYSKNDIQSIMKTLFDHDSNIINGYTYLMNYDWNDSFLGSINVSFFRSYLNLKKLQECFRIMLPTSSYIIFEVTDYNGYASEKQWEWFNKTTLTIVPEKIIEKEDNGNEDENQNPIELIDKEFEHIVGLKGIKNDLKKFYNHFNILKIREERNLKSENIPLHAVFKGPPGTGKTTVARLLGKIYKSLGILDKGHVVEVDRGGLVAGYIGHTTKKTTEKLEEALGGILFIDEAYSLARGEDDPKDYGKEVIQTILKYMEDNRNKISIIVAGYENEMDNFINSNPGLKSRFTKYYNFKNYSVDELTEIFQIFLSKEDYKTSNNILNNYVKDFLKKYKDNSDPNSFGNGRDIRNLFDQLKLIQSQRISSFENYKKQGDSFFTNIEKQDIEALYIEHNFDLPVIKKKK